MGTGGNGDGGKMFQSETLGDSGKMFQNVTLGER